MGQEEKIVSVTINPAIDQTVIIPNFRAGAVNRVQSSQVDAGGKGVNVASFLADYGEPVTITGFMGAGNDEIFRHLFERKRIVNRCVRIAGQTRISVKVSDQILNLTTDINFPGETPSEADIFHLFDILTELAATHDWFILTGSIPYGVSASIYADMVDRLAGKKIVLDTSGEGFRLAVAAGPWLIKPNVDELANIPGKYWIRPPLFWNRLIQSSNVITSISWLFRWERKALSSLKTMRQFGQYLRLSR